MRQYTWRRFVIGVFLACLWSVSREAAPAHPHPCVCSAVDRPQRAHFDGASIRFIIHPGDSLWFGLARPNEFESWWQSRAKE